MVTGMPGPIGANAPLLVVYPKKSGRETVILPAMEETELAPLKVWELNYRTVTTQYAKVI